MEARQIEARTGKLVTPKGCIDLPITLGEGNTQLTKVAEFVVIDVRSA